MSSIAEFHTRFFTVLAEAVPGLTHLHYGLSDDDSRSLWGTPLRLREGPWRTLEQLIDAGELHTLPPGSRGLDVGCGLGGTLSVLAHEFEHQLTGVNITEVQVERARARMAEEGIEDLVEVLHADATALPLPDESVDYAVMIECAFHVADKPRLFAELARVLRPGGRLLLLDQERAAGDLEVMGLFYFVEEGRYPALAEAAGLTLTAQWDLSHELANWMADYARAAAKPFHWAVMALCALRLKPGLALEYWRGVQHFEALLREDLAGRGIQVGPRDNAVRALRLHTLAELEDGRSSYCIWRFDKPEEAS
ncbi:MAG: class I SAM-dependent methyltransferase [Alphaproteobacteria bacterium]|nr:class I SAM-dependent methyltransferase [Alphaproteobacteria bacterium]